jgi:phosphoglycerate kinase
MLVSCPLSAAADPPPPGSALTCRFPCGATSPGRWEAGAVVCALPPGVDGGACAPGAAAGCGGPAPLAAVATVEVVPPPPPPRPPCCGGRPCGPGTVITAPPASSPPAWMARAAVDGLPPATLAGAAAWVRADLNAPLHADGSVADASRLAAAVPTVAFLLGAGARVVAVASHLGRPAGPDPACSLARVAPAFEGALRAGGLPTVSVTFVPASTGPAVADAVRAAPPGSVLLLENVRFHGAAETGDDPKLAAALVPADVFDLVVNDAFGAAHRAHASTAGVAAVAAASGRPAVAGLLLRAELAALGRTLCCPRRPLLAIVGGAKLSSKARIIERLVGHADAVALGGALATTFLAALAPTATEEGGPAVGGGVEPSEFGAARAAAAAASAAGTRLVLPVDVVAAPRTADGGGWDAARAVTVPATAVPPGFTALDAGPATVAAVADLAASAWTVVWNGPFGLAEDPAFAAGTAGVAAALAPLAAARGTTTIVGGGHSVAAVAAAGLTSAFSHVSTGGGATLELLEGVVLPGVAALQEGPGLSGVCD